MEDASAAGGETSSTTGTANESGAAKNKPNDTPDEDLKGGMLMPFDDGSMSSDKAQSSAMGLVINFADPFYAAGTAVFGLGLLVLPMLTRLNNISVGEGYDDLKGAFSYNAHGETNTKQSMRLFTEAEMRQRLGQLDAAFLAKEISMSNSALDEHMDESGTEVVEDEVSKIQKWRDTVNTNMKTLQKRSALAFLGLPPEANEGDINKMYKKMAFELHPDRGGDPEKFKELQEMKERLNEIDKEDEDKKNDDDEPEDEEAKKQKEEEKRKDEEEKAKIPPAERSKQLRMEVHDNTVRIWARAKKSLEDFTGEKAKKGNAQPALNILRQFVDRFVTNEVKTLRADDKKGAEAKFRKFLKQGAEIIAVAAMQDVQSTLETVAMHFNYRIIARSGSPDIQRKCAALLEAVADVPTKAEAFIKDLDTALAEQQDRDKRRKEEKAAAQREREKKGDLRGDAAEADDAKKTAAEAKASSSTANAARDPFGDFDWGKPAPKKMPEPKAAAKAAEPVTTLKTKEEEEKSAISAAVNQQKRNGWDPTFDHPYAGALKSNGTGIYCRPCQRWIMTYEYNTEVFLTHVERVHPKRVPGF